MRSEVCSDWTAIQCILIGQIPQVCDGNVTPLTVLWCRVQARRDQNNKTQYKQGICCIQWGHCAAPHKHNTLSAFVIGETPNKHYSTLLKDRVWIVSRKFFKYKNNLIGCESEAPDCPCNVGIAPLYSVHIVGSPRIRKQSSVQCAAHTRIFALYRSGTVLWIQLNHWFLVVYSFGRPNKVLSQPNTASPWHGASNNTTLRIKVTPSFIAYMFGWCYANLPTLWRRHVGGCLNEPF